MTAIKIKEFDFDEVPRHGNSRPQITINPIKGNFYLSHAGATKLGIGQGHKTAYLKFGTGDDNSLYVKNVNHDKGAIRLRLTSSKSYVASCKPCIMELFKESKLSTSYKIVFNINANDGDWYFIAPDKKATDYAQ